jgi:transglutaminase-like putative cysteine protease
MMSLHRRDLLKAGIAASVAIGLPRGVSAQTEFAPRLAEWRSFAVTSRIEIARPNGKTQVWIPLPSINESDWFRSLGSEWTGNAASTMLQEPVYGAQMLQVAWADGTDSCIVEVTSRIATRDRGIDLAKPATPPPLSTTQRELYTRGTDFIPVDGIVKETSDKIVGEAKTDVDKARAIYEWVVDHTFRAAEVRGCGVGDIVAMLRSGNLGGKCADINALYVGLARSAGLPARDIYGIRVAPSRFGYKSLGANSASISKAQHCRSEVYLAGFGWVAVDPADVRKVVLEEPPAHLSLEDAKVIAARSALFGAWEGNWLAYNFAHDVALPGSTGPQLAFLMYPQAEIAGERLDCLNADTFKYAIAAKELTPA